MGLGVLGDEGGGGLMQQTNRFLPPSVFLSLPHIHTHARLNMQFPIIHKKRKRKAEVCFQLCLNFNVG